MALDYRFIRDGFELRLNDRVRSGWTKGPYGHYYGGVGKFVWKFGIRGRAEVKLFPQSATCILDTIESLNSSAPAEGHLTSWALQDGVIWWVDPGEPVGQPVRSR